MAFMHITLKVVLNLQHETNNPVHYTPTSSDQPSYKNGVLLILTQFMFVHNCDIVCRNQSFSHCVIVNLHSDVLLHVISTCQVLTSVPHKKKPCLLSMC